MLLDNFEITVSRAEDVGKLNGLILQLAVQGKLVAQDPTDEPASDLLKRIAAEKKRLKIKSQPLPEIGDEERPFVLPDSWEWVRLENITEKIADIDHKMPKAVDEGGVKFLSAKDLLDDGTLNFEHNIKYISEEDFQRLSRKAIPQQNDIIYSRIGARLGKARVVFTDERFLVSYSCCIVRPIHLLDVLYLNYYLDSGEVLKQAQTHTKSIGVPDLGLQKIREFMVPLPPLAEQKRIVTRVNALFHLCDELSAHIQEAQATRAALRDAVLGS